MIIFIVGNKVDNLEDRKISHEEAKIFAEKYKAQYIETSAKNDVGVNELFDSVFNSLLKKLNVFSHCYLV